MSKFEKELEALESKAEITLEQVNLSNDFLFAKTMEDKEVCKRVLEEILKKKIREIKQPVTQKSLKVNELSKGIRLDVYVEDKKNTVFNIEMQTTNNPNLAKRSRYYQGIIDSSLIQAGADYSALNKSYIIFICTFDPFKRGRYKYTFKNTCQEENNLILEDESVKIFLNTKGEVDDVSDDLRAFLRYVECSTEDVVQEHDSDLVRIVAKRVEEVKENKRLRREFMTLEMKFREERQQGIQLGRHQGEREKQISVAINAFKRNLDDELISEITGLSLEEVQQLREENEK